MDDSHVVPNGGDCAVWFNMYASRIEPEVKMIGYQTNKKPNAPLVKRLNITLFKASKNPDLSEVLNKLSEIQTKLKKGSTVSSFQNAMAEKSREIARLKRIANRETLTGQALETFKSDIYKLASRMQTFAVARKDLPNLDHTELHEIHVTLRAIQADFKTGADLAPHKLRSEPIVIVPPSATFSQSA